MDTWKTAHPRCRQRATHEAHQAQDSQRIQRDMRLHRYVNTAQSSETFGAFWPWPQAGPPFSIPVSSVSLTHLPINLLWVGPCPNMGLVNGHREAPGFHQGSGNSNQKVSLGLSTLLARHSFPPLVFLLNVPLTTHSGPISFQPPKP